MLPEEFPDLPNLPIHIHLLPIHKAAEPNLFRSVLCHHAKAFPIRKGEPLYSFPIPEMDCFQFSLLLSAYPHLFHLLILLLSGNYTAHDSNAKGCACHYPKSHSCKKHFTSLLSRLPGDWGSPQSAFGYPNAMLAKPVPSIQIDSPMQVLFNVLFDISSLDGSTFYSHSPFDLKYNIHRHHPPPDFHIPLLVT